MMTIQQLCETLHQTTRLLTGATGNDPFLSRADAERLFSSLEGPIRVFANELYHLAQELEPSKGGRITRSDIEKVVQVIEEKILPELEIPSQPLTDEEAERLEALGEVYVRVARSWKDLALDQTTMTLEDLVNTLSQLCKNLYFNEFYKDQADIKAYLLPARLQTLTIENFRDALYQSGDQAFYQLNRYLENPSPTKPADEFFRQFPTVQTEENRPLAEQVVTLMKTHLTELQYFRFQSNHYENTAYFVAGLADTGEVVFLSQVYFWN